MRDLGTIDDPAHARTVSLVLTARGIANELRDDDDGLHLWVLDDARVDDGRAVREEVLAAPDAARFADEATQGKAAHAREAAKDAAYAARTRLARTSIHGADGRGTITLIVLGLTAVVAMLSQLGHDPERISGLFFTLRPARALCPEIRAGQVWRLVTPILVHFGVLHLLFNASMWLRFAGRIEARKGARFFVVMLLVGAVLSNAAQFGWQYLTAPRGVGLFGGLSGVLYTLFGYAWFKGRIDPTDRLEVDPATVNLLVGWLIVCMSGLMGPIANAAHVGGLVVGVAWAFVDRAWFQWRKSRRGP
ncbi:MAG: rhomboid family intramembrane serine protease [Alphaproteobacteria bacterium]|nr:rhomboid family intramembrane serine protease [Alphaproteobacteria bacterium]